MGSENNFGIFKHSQYFRNAMNTMKHTKRNKKPL